MTYRLILKAAGNNQRTNSTTLVHVQYLCMKYVMGRVSLTMGASGLYNPFVLHPHILLSKLSVAFKQRTVKCPVSLYDAHFIHIAWFCFERPGGLARTNFPPVFASFRWLAALRLAMVDGSP